MITSENLVRLAGPTLKDAQAWFSALRPHASGVYVDGWVLHDGFQGADGVTLEAARIISSTVKKILVNSYRWPDALAVYDLCADAHPRNGQPQVHPSP